MEAYVQLRWGALKATAQAVSDVSTMSKCDTAAIQRCRKSVIKPLAGLRVGLDSHCDATQHQQHECRY